MKPPALSCPIGVFDSGVGGLSVLRQLLIHLPHEDMVYLADTAWAPYGERSSADIAERSLHITAYLLAQHHIKALVVACNTATAQAVQALRQAWPDLPLVGIEPAIKPAAQLTRTGHIGVLATQGTVRSTKFQQLAENWRGNNTLHVQACNGLALAIENALDGQTNPDGATVESLCQRYTDALRPFVGDAGGAGDPCASDTPSRPGIDTLVLGCTHYTFAAEVLQKLVGQQVQLMEPGEPVALHTQRRLHQAGLLRSCDAPGQSGQLTLLATAAPQRLSQAARVWLGLAQNEARLASIAYSQQQK